MEEIGRALDLVRSCFPYKDGAFYGSADGLNVGVGLIYDGIRYPLFDQDSRLFDTVEGPVYVLTHECDIDQSNDRHFNDHVLVCPIILFDQLLKETVSSSSESKIFNMLPNIVSDKVYRVFFFPPIHEGTLAYGGLIYLNQLCSTHIGEFSSEAAHPICALSEYAQNILDKKLQNHLLRPKEEQLPRLQ